MPELEEGQNPTTQEDMDSELNNENVSPAQRRRMEKMDRKNVDTKDLEEALEDAFDAYTGARGDID